MSGMLMPGGWTMSMTWMRTPGQTWPGAAAAFLGMWIVMMAAMMLPSLVPVLWRYRDAAAAIGAPRAGRMTALAGAGYFTVWAAFGLMLFPVGVALAAIEMAQPAIARAVPIVAGIVVLMAAVTQFSAAKARHLACCGQIAAAGGRPAATAVAAWRGGLRHGLHCVRACAGPTAILLVLGVMDPGVMAVVTAAITLERTVPSGARAVGVAGLLAGLVLVARAAGLA